MGRLPCFFVSVLVLTVLWVGPEKILGKECTNIPRKNISHTLRSLVLKKEGNIAHGHRSPGPRGEGRITGGPSKTNPRSTATRFVLKKKRPITGHLPVNYVARVEHLPIHEATGHSSTTPSPNPFSKTVSVNAFSQLSGGQYWNSSCTAVEGNSALARSHSVQLSLLKEVLLHRVTLASDSAQGRAQETNLRYLLMLDVDRLVWSFRATADLPAPGTPYGGWEEPSSELRGHFVGHYLSATALMWATTHNGSLRGKMTLLVEALGECQDQIGTGYLSAFPSSFFDRFEAIDGVWAPYYTIHKIMAGLLDQYSFANNRRAFTILLWMASYFLSRVEAVIETFTIERHWQSLNEETGGMNDVMYRLFKITGDSGHLRLAHLFDKPCFLGPLALQTDGLSSFHANSHIPIVVGSQMRYEATGDVLYRVLATYFMEIINSSHSYATGGTSQAEFWQDPNRIGSTLERENQETCTTYNMLKIARNLFQWTKDARYADYYERALVNGILGIQRGDEPGVMIYMLPQGPGSSKAISYHGWGTTFDSFWCCYGTGIESFSKLGDSIYFEEQNSVAALYVTQFVSSSLFWETAGLLLTQTVQGPSSHDPWLHITYDFSELSGATGGQATLLLRIASWTDESKWSTNLNGGLIHPRSDGNFLSLTHTWQPGDVVEVDIPVLLRLERIKDDRQDYSSLHAVLFGPYVLAGMTTGDWELGAVNASVPSSWLVPVPESYSNDLRTFSQGPSTSTPGSAPDIAIDQAFVLGHREGSATMSPAPSQGTNEAAQSTFRLVPASVAPSRFPKAVLEQDGAVNEAKHVDEWVSLELYNQPRKVLAHAGADSQIIVVDGSGSRDEGLPANEISNHEEGTVFRLLPGLSGTANCVSFEAATLPGCFLSSNLNSGDGLSITLRCEPAEEDPGFNASTSFLASKGLATYHPLSFIAEGPMNRFLLFPISAYKDESYTTYFDLS